MVYKVTVILVSVLLLPHPYARMNSYSTKQLCIPEVNTDIDECALFLTLSGLYDAGGIKWFLLRT